MMHAKSESDVTSLELSTTSPRSSNRPVYYVQSPSRDSHDDKSSSRSNQPTPSYNSPSDSPSLYLAGRHSQVSASSRVSGTYVRRNNGGGNAANGKGDAWQVVVEEGEEEEEEEEGGGLPRWCRVGLVGLVGFCAVFFMFCLIIWGAARPCKPTVAVQSLVVHSFYFGQGSDLTGVPTKMMTINCSVKMAVYNPATFFGIYVSSLPVDLMYSQITVATGEMKKYYQRRNSHRAVTVDLQGTGVPLYGAGASLAITETKVPLTLVFEVRSRGDVVGTLVKSKHTQRISCSLVIDSSSSEPLKVREDSCTYR